MGSYKATIKTEPAANFVEDGFPEEDDGPNDENFNASSSLSFSDTSSHNQLNARKRPLSNAERQKRYREKLKNSEYYAQWRKASADRVKIRRENYKVYLESLTEGEKLAVMEKNRGDNRARLRRNRETKKVKEMVQDFEPKDVKEESCGHTNCQICPAYFAMRIRWEQHIAEELQGQKKTRHDCCECGIEYQTADYLDGHLLAHSADGKFHQCQHCLVAFTNHQELQVHLAVRLKQGSCNTLWPGIYSDA